MTTLKKQSLAIAVLVVISSMMGCGGSMNNTPVPIPNTATANLRVVSMDPSTGLVTVTVGGKTIATNLQYLGNTGYVSVPAGSATLDISNQIPPNGRMILNLAPGSQTTFFEDGWGTFESSTTFLTDDNIASPTSAKLRIMNAAVEGEGDFYLLPAGSTPSGTPLVSAPNFNSVTSYQVLAPGSYEVFVTFFQTPSQILFDSGPITLAAGQNRTVVVSSDCQPTTCGFDQFVSITLADMN
jgi:hypothetical protein